jgi:hypothetical protein
LFGTLFCLLALHVLVVYFSPDGWKMAETVQEMRVFLGVSDGVVYDRQRAAMRTRQRIVMVDARPHLWAGPNDSDHFDVTEFRLDPRQLHYGLGRERFAALIEPTFTTVAEADATGRLGGGGSGQVLVVKIGDEVKVYPVTALMRHEVVNDVVGGRPIFAAYCVLANLGAVYDRQMNDHTYTFGVSGYTYADVTVWDGRQAFVLWDRDTESLWWPPLGKAVSGPAIDMPMKVLEHELWAQMNWTQVREKYPDARVLRFGQQMTTPTDWPRHEITRRHDTIQDNATDANEKADESAIAPRWGENASL